MAGCRQREWPVHWLNLHLENTVSGERYISNVIDAKDGRSFVDYGLIASFSVAENKQMVILTGTRDAALMEISELAIAPNLLTRMQLDANKKISLLFCI